jgi:hypothetical protein
MSKLTTKNFWKSNAVKSDNYKNIIDHSNKLEWVKIIKKYLLTLNDSDKLYSYVELGGCPGYITDAITDKLSFKDIYIIDYVNCSNILNKYIFEKKEKKFISSDIILNNNVVSNIPSPKIICSYGLIEHFTGNDLDLILSAHLNYLTKSDVVVIEFPNFTGFKFFWHIIFDRKDLLKHNLELMNDPDIISTLGFKVIYKGWTDPPYVWGNSSVPKFLNKLLIRILYKLEVFINYFLRIIFSKNIKGGRTRFFSSFYLLILEKN